jgi:ketosteroid isomerase-like protein
MRYSVSTVLALAALASGALAAPNAAAIKAELQAKYDQAVKYTRAKDVKALMSMSTRDFTVTMMNGQTYDRAETEKTMRQSFSSIKSVKTSKSQVTAVKPSADGKSVVASTVNIWEGKIQAPDGKVHTMKQQFATMDTWVRSGSTWLMKQQRIVKDVYWMDGKPYNPYAGLKSGG